MPLHDIARLNIKTVHCVILLQSPLKLKSDDIPIGRDEIQPSQAHVQSPWYEKPCDRLGSFPYFLPQLHMSLTGMNKKLMKNFPFCRELKPHISIIITNITHDVAPKLHIKFYFQQQHRNVMLTLNSLVEMHIRCIT